MVFNYRNFHSVPIWDLFYIIHTSILQLSKESTLYQQKKKKHYLPQSIEILDKICIDVFTRNPPDNRILKMPSRAIASSEFCFFENLISHVHNMVNKYNCRLCHSFVHIYIYIFICTYIIFFLIIKEKKRAEQFIKIFISLYLSLRTIQPYQKIYFCYYQKRN